MLCSSDLNIYVFVPICHPYNFDLEERISPDKLKQKKKQNRQSYLANLYLSVHVFTYICLRC